MNDINHSICCDVKTCKHNAMGSNCTLNKIKVTCDCSDCTCCGSYDCSNNG